MKVSVIYNHETAAILAIQYGQETAADDVRNVVVEIDEGEQLTGITIDGDTVTPITEETQASALTKEIQALTAQVEYLSMMSGIETEAVDE